MAYFYIWETVTFPIHLSDAGALNDVNQIIVSLKQKDVQVDIVDPEYDASESMIYLRLEQEDTSKFRKGNVILQINIYYNDTERDTTKQVTIEALDNLYKKVMP